MASMKGMTSGMGFEKEPPVQHGPKETGKALVHSHSKRPKTKIVIGKRHGRKR
jgi:hypothetical protein